MFIKIKDIILKFKMYFFTVGLLIVIVLATLIAERQYGETPYKVIEPDTLSKEFRLLEIDPPSGVRNTMDSRSYIKFTFSLPVNVNTAVIRAEPQIDLKVRVFEHDPYTLVLIPGTNAWEDEVQYSVTLAGSLTSTTGETLSQDIPYTYYNIRPETVYTGEDVFVEEEKPSR